MLVLHLAIVVLGEKFRRSVPNTAQALAHLGAALFVPTGISSVATAGGSWRSCILAGGVVGLAALEVQARRWRSRWMNGLQVGALALAMAGAAAITHVPIGLLLGLAAAGVMMSTNRHIESFSLAALTALTPVLALLARAKFGPGTIAELGANGRSLAWAAPLAGLLGAAVFIQLSRMYVRWQMWLVAASLGSAVSGGLIGLAYLQPSPTVAACGAPVLLVLFELAVHGRLVERLVPNDAGRIRSFNGFVEFFEIITLATLLTESFGYRAAQPRYAPLLIAAVGLALGAARTERLFVPRVAAATGAALCGVGALATISDSVWPVAWSMWLAVVAIAWILRNRLVGNLAAVTAPILLLGELLDAGVRHQTWQGVLVALAIAAFGVSASLRKGLTPLDATGLTSLLIAALGFQRPIHQAIAFTGFGLVAFVVGRLYRHRRMERFGEASAAVGALWVYGLWSATGLVKFDVVSLVLVTLAVVGERQARSKLSNAAGGPEFLAPVLYSTVYLLTTAFAEQTSARIGAAILIGIVALGVGVLTKRPAVTVGGAITVVGGGTIATWEQLGAMPTWAWLLLGGLGLLGLAVVVERRRPAS
jgi:hypothetical protein